MERFFIPDEEPQDLEFITTEALTEELRNRRLTLASEGSLIDSLAASDSLAPLLKTVIGQVLPFI